MIAKILIDMIGVLKMLWSINYNKENCFYNDASKIV